MSLLVYSELQLRKADWATKKKAQTILVDDIVIGKKTSSLLALLKKAKKPKGKVNEKRQGKKNSRKINDTDKRIPIGLHLFP